jgi:hypothetical protein
VACELRVRINPVVRYRDATPHGKGYLVLSRFADLTVPLHPAARPIAGGVAAGDLEILVLRHQLTVLRQRWRAVRTCQ